MTDDYTFDPHALALLDDPHRPVMVTGGAGTGKSTLIRHWRASHPEWNILTCAPTGVAALNVDGVTIHRLIHSGADVDPEKAARAGRRARMDPGEARLYANLDALVVDEMSMMRADLTDALDRFLRAVRGSRRPFGGVKTVLVGDLAQLPPVVQEEETAMFGPDGEWEGPWCFQSRVLAESGSLGFVELTEVHRQADPAFAGALNMMREGGTGGLPLVNSRVGAPWDPERTVTLTAYNRRADEINDRMLSRLPTPEWRRAAQTAGQWNPRLDPAPKLLRMRAGMRVMLLSNDRAGRWANGSTGVLVSYDPHADEALVLPDGADAPVLVAPHEWRVTRPQIVTDPDDPEGRPRIEQRPLGSFSQLPIRPAWAVSIHKSQGGTFDRVRVELPARPLFAPGQAYVAFSRCRTLEGMSVNRALTVADVRADPAAITFLHRMRARPAAYQTALF